MKKTAVFPLFVVLGLVVSAYGSANPARQPSYVLLEVNTLNPTAIFGDGLCSLSEAIVNANTNSQVGSTDCPAGLDDQDIISFQVAGTVTLGADLLPITDGLEIHGAEAGTVISGADAYKIFQFDPPVTTHTLILEELTIEHGDAGASQGGGLRKLKGNAEVRSCTLRYNEARIAGAIYNGAGNMTVINSTVYENTATVLDGATGGGLLNGSGWTVNIISSTFASNHASAGGSNLHNASGTIQLFNSIIANGAGAPNCNTALSDINNNLESGNCCGLNTSHGSLINTDPLLGEPGWHGGPTDTLPLLSGSPAIDGVTYNIPNGSLEFDQRNMPRPRDGDQDGTRRHDIGAYEFGEPKVYLPVVGVP